MQTTSSTQRRRIPLVWNGAMPHAAHGSPLSAVQPVAGQGLYKLVLVVAEACNLRCTYCYAEGGPYGREVSVMSPDTARRAVREMFTRHSPIQTLQFFGGEPSLNLAAMQAAVDEVRQMVAEGALSAEPRFSIVTNGALLTDDLLRFYVDADLLITVSHDGPQEIQDELRPRAAGGGTFDQVDRTLDRFRAAGVRFDVQCTYTRKHMRAGYRVPDLVRWFHERGAQLIHVVPVSVPAGSDLDVWFSEGYEDMLAGFREAVRMTFDAIDAGSPLRFGMVQEAMQLLRRGQSESKHYCNAGVTTLTVAANGEIYPCFMFINKQGFVMGHVDSAHELGAFRRDAAHGADFGCPGREFMMSGEIRPFQRDDLLKKAVVEELLVCLDERLAIAEGELGLVRSSNG